MSCPFWLSFLILFVVAIGILLPIRGIFEKLPYNNSFSSKYGVLSLILIIMIGADVLKRMVYVDGWMGTVWFHLIVAIVAIAVGLVWQYTTKTTTPGDSFHNLVGVPVIVYFLVTTILPTFWYSTLLENVGMIVLGAVWVWLVRYDRRTGRLDQTKWLAHHYRE